MTNLFRLTAAAALVGAAAATSALATPGNGHGGGAGRPTHGRSELSRPEVDPPDDNAVGRLDLKFFPATDSRAERSWVRFRLRHLDKAGVYTVWADDPSTVGTVDMVQVGELTMNGGGNLNERLDTKDGDTMPFAPTFTLAQLAGLAVEIRNADGSVVVLAGTFPAMD